MYVLSSVNEGYAGVSKIRKNESRSHGVMVSTLDFESSDPSSNLGGTYIFSFFFFFFFILTKDSL